VALSETAVAEGAERRGAADQAARLELDTPPVAPVNPENAAPAETEGALDT
jgi:hypothetical protein